MGKKDLKQASQQRKSDLSLSITEQTWPSNGGGGSSGHWETAVGWAQGETSSFKSTVAKPRNFRGMVSPKRG